MCPAQNNDDNKAPLFDNHPPAPASAGRVRIVLVEPQTPENVGAVARAMKTMGLSDWAIVGGCDIHSRGARRLARSASTLLESARCVATFEEAVEGVDRVVSTSHRLRSQQLQRVAALKERLPEWQQRLVSGQRLAVVFGREDKGLPRVILERSDELVTIPTAHSAQSLNLAQAVMIVCYELFQSLAEHPAAPPIAESLNHAERQSLAKMWTDLAIETGYEVRGQRPELLVNSLAQSFAEWSLTERDRLLSLSLLRHFQRVFRSLEKNDSHADSH